MISGVVVLHLCMASGEPSATVVAPAPSPAARKTDVNVRYQQVPHDGRP